MTDPQVLLERERDEVTRRLAALTEDYEGVVAASRDTNADDEHDPEGATIAFERAQVDAMVKEAFADFLRQRTRPAWNRSILPALRDWCVEGLRVDNSA